MSRTWTLSWSGPRGPLNWKANLFFIWLSQILTLAGFGAAMPFIPLFIRDALGIISEKERGFWVSMFYFFGMLSFCASNPLWGVLADRYGRRLMLLRANFVSAILFPLMVLAPNIQMLIFFRFLASAFSGTVAAAQALIAASTPDQSQGFAQGILSTAIWSGNMIGYLVGGVIMHYLGYTWAFCLCGVMYFLGGLIVLFLVQEDHGGRQKQTLKNVAADKEKEETAERVNIFAKIAARFRLKSFNIPRFPPLVLSLIGICMLIYITRRFEEPYLAMLVEIIGGREKAALNTGLICAAAALGGIFSGPLFGRLSDRLPPVVVLVPALLSSSLLLFAQGVATSIPFLAYCRFGAYFSAGGLEPSILAIISKVTPSHQRATVFGWTTSARTLGMVLSAPLAGIFIASWGTRSVFVTAGALYLVILPIIVKTMKKLPDKNKQ